MILAVLLHHLEAGETKTGGQRCPKTCVSGNSFLEGYLSGDILLVGLLKKNV